MFVYDAYIYVKNNILCCIFYYASIKIIKTSLDIFEYKILLQIQKTSQLF